MGVLYMHSHLLVTRVRLPPTPTLTLALAPADRSGQPVKTDAAKYIKHLDAEGIVKYCKYCDAFTCRRYCQVCHAGIGDFLDASIEDLASVLSFTVDYLAGPRRTLTVGPVACSSLRPGIWCVPGPGVLGVLGVLGASAPLSASHGARDRVWW